MLLLFLLLLFLEKSSVYIITAAEVQNENEDCQTDENCRGEVHGKDWCLMALLMTFYTGRLTAGPGLRHFRYQLHVTITPYNTTSIRAIYQSIYNCSEYPDITFVLKSSQILIQDFVNDRMEFLFVRVDLCHRNDEN